MKKILMFLTLVLFSTPVLADHHLVYIRSIVKISSTQCAIELEISGDNQDGFSANDSIEINNQETVKFTNLVGAGINGVSGNNDTGNRILAASLSFSSQQGLTGDLSFADTECDRLDSDAVIDFLNDDAVNPIDSVDAATLSGFGADNTAISKTSLAATPQLINLATTQRTLSNNSGEVITIGTTASNEGLAVNCSLNPAKPRPQWFDHLILSFKHFLK